MITDPRLFDLNIKKILETRGAAHANRELSANALDEQILTGTKDVQINKPDGTRIIHDYSRGLRCDHVARNEPAEKPKNVGKVIGKLASA